MALRVIVKGNKNKNNDHNKLVNKNMANQHPIESITNLRVELDSKYVKPITGIPSTDLAFNIVTAEDLDRVTSFLEQKLIVVQGSIEDTNIRVDIIEDLLSQLTPKPDVDESVSNKFAYKQGFRDDYISEDGDTDFQTSDSFIVGGKHLQVYRDGELLTCGQDYDEVSNYSIKFKYQLDADVLVTLLCPYSHTVISPIHEEIVTSKSQEEFTLQNAIAVGSNSLSVYVNGIRLECGSHYQEVTDNLVRLVTDPFEEGTKVIFRQEGISSKTLTYDDKIFEQKPFVVSKTIDEDGVVLIEFNEAYIPQSSAIDVYLNGILQFENLDYIEKTENSVEFIDELEVGDIVRICSSIHINKWSYKYIAPTDLKILEFENEYIPNRDDLLVYENGVLLFSGEDYLEVNHRSIRFFEDIPRGTRIIVKKRR